MASKILQHLSKIRLASDVGSVQKLEQYFIRCGTRSAVSRARFIGGSSISHFERSEDSRLGGSLVHTSLFHTSAAKLDGVQTIKCPPFAESITEGDIKWEIEVGDAVTADQTVAEIETDKTSITVPSPAAGVILELLVPDGERVEAGQDLCKLEVGAGGGAAAAAPAAPAPETPAAPAAPAAPAPAAPAAPVAKAEIPKAPPPIPPVPTKPISVTPPSAVTPVKAVDPAVIGGSRAESRVKMNRMRLRIAQRLKDAQNTCAMLTTFQEIDMSNIIELRNSYKDAFQKKHGIKLGFMSAFLKASAYALQDQPVVNAVIDGNEIVYRDFIDISVAVAAPKGLVVPVIRNVEKMNYVDIERTLVELGEKAKKGDLAIEDMDGGTFTVSNGGVFGSLMGTPIINPPQSAILGMHATKMRPVAVGGKVEIRPIMFVALTYDHRLIDGKEAVTFLKKIQAAVEDPRIMFLDV